MERAYIVHALSPLHAGTGQSQGAIDLPIARLRGTRIPYLPGSSIKGVLRDAKEGRLQSGDLHREVFGPPVDLAQDDARVAGAVSFGDARLLALPVRSYRGTFAWVTSPLLLRLAKRDTGWSIPVPNVTQPGGARVTTTSVLHANGYVFLEEVECPVQDQAGAQVDPWAKAIADNLFHGDDSWFKERFVVVHDETMTYLWECCTQVDARIRLNEDGVVAKGALWYEESLPAESLLLGVAVVTSRPNRHTPEATLLDACFGQETAGLQFGGKSTVGRGRARLIPLTVAPANQEVP